MTPPRPDTPTRAHAEPSTSVARVRLAPPKPEITDADRPWIERFNNIYRAADGDHTAIPWSHARPNPLLIEWVDRAAAQTRPPNPRVAVVGCGLGTDAAALADRKLRVTAFDACPDAIRSARSLHPRHAHIFRVADLLTPPDDLAAAFDLVAEVHTLQSLPPEYRDPLARAMADLLTPGGTLVAVARGRADDTPLTPDAGPPFPFTPDELIRTIEHAGLTVERPIHDAHDSNQPPVRRLRVVAHKPRW